MNPDPAKLAPSDEAIEWLTRLRATDVTAAERGEFALWLSHGDNRATFDAALDLWGQLEVLGTLDLPVPHRSKPSRWVPLAAAASLMLGLLMAVAYQNLGDEFTTTTGELRLVGLQDGSRIHLNTDSKAVVRLKSNIRHVRLDGGEAYFNVQADIHRPFVVSTEHAEITVVGTAFAVHAKGGLTKVSVTEGLVTIQGGSQPARRLYPGEQALITASYTEVTPVKLDTIATWRFGRLEYKNVTIAEIVEDLNRYLPKTIVVQDETLRQQHCPVTSVLQLQDRDGMLDALSLTCPIRWKSLSDDVILILPAS